jgi:Spy/CpxP family protein refolding chaperone
VKTILRKYQPTVGPLIKEVVTERRTLRDAIHAEIIDETAIRAQAAKVASLESDLAVQRAQLRVIVAEGQGELKVIRKQIQPQVEDLLTRSEAKVRALLRPDQQEKFDKLIAERKARWASSNDG